MVVMGSKEQGRLGDRNRQGQEKKKNLGENKKTGKNKNWEQKGKGIRGGSRNMSSDKVKEKKRGQKKTLQTVTCKVRQKKQDSKKKTRTEKKKRKGKSRRRRIPRGTDKNRQ